MIATSSNYLFYEHLLNFIHLSANSIKFIGGWKC